LNDPQLVIVFIPTHKVKYTMLSWIQTSYKGTPGGWRMDWDSGFQDVKIALLNKSGQIWQIAALRPFLDELIRRAVKADND
jgi:hypothetical protein